MIYLMNKAGNKQSEIARVLGVSQSSISKELKRNRGGRGYRPDQAHRFALERQASKAREPVMVGAVSKEVIRRLELKHSPEQISGAMRAESIPGPSHETIYQFLARDRQEGGKLYTHLRINRKRRYRRRSKAGRGKIPERVGIAERPASVEARIHYGHWEADLLEGAKGSGYVLSLYERKSMTGLLWKIEDKTAASASQAIIALGRGIKFRSISYDNGLEFSAHQEVNAALGCRSYFCNPYCSWEKGGVENLNGLIRQYLPKGTDFREIDQAQIKKIQDSLNSRPRKKLHFKSPSTYQLKLAA